MGGFFGSGASALLVIGLLASAVPCHGAGGENTKMQDIASSITTAKKLFPDTTITKSGHAQAVIVAPEGEDFARLAHKVKGAVRQASGVELAITKDRSVADRFGRIRGKGLETNVILLGNLQTSGLVTHFYTRGCCVVDAAYPGKGDWVIQTVHDPWGRGTNVILLGGSDIAGIEKSVLRFCESLPPDGMIRFPGRLQVGFPTHYLKRFPEFFNDPTDEEIVQKTAEADKAFRAGQHGGIFPQIRNAGHAYIRTGHEGYAKLFRSLLFLAHDLYRQDLGTYGGPWGMDADFSFADLITSLDGVEESPSLSNEDRLKITNIILEYIKFWESYWSVKPVAKREIRNNHTTFTCLGFMFAADYFDKYYSLPQAKGWMKIADDCFKPQQKSFKPEEDSNSYQWITLTHMMRYALGRTDPTFITSQKAKTAADLAVMTMDNLGYQVSFGDVGAFSGGTAETSIWRSLAAVTDDGRYTWAYEKSNDVRSSGHFGCYASDVTPEEPKDLLGVKWLETDPAFYKHWNGKGIVPQEKTFEKITFRDSFDKNRPYLILDGINACGHGHYDGNSILRFTDRGRIWLCDCDYIKSQPKFHNSLIVYRNGQSSGLPAFCELEFSADLHSTGISKTTIPGYAEADWSRSIIWDRKNTFVVIDEVKAKVEDEYSLRCHWHTLGDASIAGDLFKTSQQGADFTIQNLDGSRLRLFDQPELARNWKGYKFAEPMVRTLQQVKMVRLQAGEKAIILNVLNTHREGKEPVPAKRVSDSSVLVGSGDERALVGVGSKNELIAPGVKTDARAYRITRESIALAGATMLELDGVTVFSSEKPVSVEVPLAGNDIPRSFQISFPETQPARSIAEASVTAKDKTLTQIDTYREQGSKITRIAVDGADIYAGLTDGSVRSLVKQSSTRWIYQTGSEVRSILAGPMGIAIGTAEGKVILLDRDGKMLWERELPFYKRTPSVAYLMFADLEGDGKYALVAGSENWHHYAFDSSGKELWSYESVHASTCGTAVDLNGDGRQECILGTEYYWWHAVSADGEKLWGFRPTNGPRTTCVLAADLEGKGCHAVIFGGADGNVYALDPKGAGLWTYGTGDEISGMALADLDGDGKPETVASSLSFNVHAIDGDGKRLWRVDLGEPVMSVVAADLDGDGKTEICVGTEEGRVVVLDRSGKEIACWSGKDAVTKLSVVQGTPSRLAAICSDGSVTILDFGMTRRDVMSSVAKELGTWSKQYDHDRVDFEVGGGKGFIICPSKVLEGQKTPWVWYAPSFIGKYPGDSNEWISKQLLEAGFAVCGVDVGESYGNPTGRATFTEFYKVLVLKCGFDPKSCLWPQSRGGLMLYNWAAEHPECVRCIGGTYTVCDMSSWPGLDGACPAYGVSASELAEHLKEHNPIDRLEPIAKASVPILHIHGDSDTVVPLERNSAELAKRYKALGGQMELIVVPGKGHAEIPEFFERQEFVDFFLMHGLL